MTLETLAEAVSKEKIKDKKKVEVTIMLPDGRTFYVEEVKLQLPSGISGWEYMIVAGEEFSY